MDNGHARQRKLDLLSLLSTLTHTTWFERVVQTAAAFELMRQYPLPRANALTNRRAFGNGEYMLFSRVRALSNSSQRPPGCSFAHIAGVDWPMAAFTEFSFSRRIQTTAAYKCGFN